MRLGSLLNRAVGVGPSSVPAIDAMTLGTAESSPAHSKLTYAKDKAQHFIASLQSLGGTEITVDDGMKCLYPDPEILERMCVLSAYGGEDGFFNDDGVDDEEEDEEDEDIVKQGGGTTHCAASISNNKAPESVVDDLSTEYFDGNFDPVVGVIHDVSQWGRGDVTEKFMTKIEETDKIKDMVLNKLAAKVEANYADLMGCIHHVQAIDVDLDRAGLQTTSTRRKMNAACQLLLSGPGRISELNRRKEHLNFMVDLCKVLQMMLSVNQTMQSHIVTGDLGRAAECAYNILNSHRSHLCNQFAALEETVANVQRSVHIIGEKADKALMRLACRKFAVSEYSNIVTAYLVLDHMAESLNVNTHNVSMYPSKPEVLIDSSGSYLEGLANRILRFQLEDIDACLRTAALEFIYASQHHHRQQHKGSKFAPMEFGMSLMDLEDSPFNDLFQKVPQELLVACIIRSCELLADIVHTHYLITQWHLSPFDPLNNDSEHLHRCLICVEDVQNRGAFDDDDEDDDDDESEEKEEEEEEKEGEEGAQNLPTTVHSAACSCRVRDETRSSIVKAFEDNFDICINRSGSGPKLHEEDARIRRLQSARLAFSFQRLVQSRMELWNDILSALVNALDSMNLSTSSSLDDFLSVTWAIGTMVKLGKEFCGSDSRSLTSCLERKARDYFDTMHRWSFQALRQLLDAETWDNVIVDLAKMGGILGIILKSFSSSTRMDHEALPGSVHVTMRLTPQQDMIADCSILKMFGTIGNPLHIMTGANQASDDFEDDYDESEDIETKHDMASAKSDAKIIRERDGTTEMNGLRVLLTEDSNIVSETCRDDSMFVTQAILNGLVSSTSIYLQLMHLMPFMSSEIFLGLCRLFDFYICYVFHGFIAEEERAKFLSRSTKLTTTQSYQYGDYDELRAFLVRALAETVICDISHTKEASDDAAIVENVSATRDAIRVSAMLKTPSLVKTGDEKGYFGKSARVVAAESCIFASKILLELGPKFEQLLPDRCIVTYQSYTTSFHNVAYQLKSLVCTLSEQNKTKKSWTPFSRT